MEVRLSVKMEHPSRMLEKSFSLTRISYTQYASIILKVVCVQKRNSALLRPSCTHTRSQPAPSHVTGSCSQIVFRIQTSSRRSMTSTAPHLPAEEDTSQLFLFSSWKTCAAVAAETELNPDDVLTYARSLARACLLDFARPPRIRDLVADVLVPTTRRRSRRLA